MGKEIQKKAEPSARNRYLRVRFSAAELAQIKKNAKKAGARYASDWVRQQLGLEPTEYGKR